jgi:hypothetical protein
MTKAGEDEDMDDREKLILVGIGAAIVGGISVLLGNRNKSDRDDRGRGRAPQQQPPRPRGAAAPPQHAYTRDPAVALVVPARHAEVVAGVERLGREGGGPDELLAERLNEAVWGLWYGSKDDRNFGELESLAHESQPDEEVSVSHDFVLCLFYLTRPNRNFETGTIGRRYDGVMELAQPGAVERVFVSSPIPVTSLGSVRLTRI